MIIGEAHNEQQEKAPRAIKHLKRKDCWEDEIEAVYSKQKEAYLRYKASNYTCQISKKDMKMWKIKFKKLRNEKKDVLKDKSANKLKHLYKHDKNRFWREINKTKSVSLKTNADMSELKREYEELFSKKLIENLEQANTIHAKLDEFNRNNEGVLIDYEINTQTIITVLNSIQTVKSVRYANVEGIRQKQAPVRSTANNIYENNKQTSNALSL